MPKIARTLVGFGLLWMSLWATFGALLGARLAVFKQFSERNLLGQLEPAFDNNHAALNGHFLRTNFDRWRSLTLRKAQQHPLEGNDK